ncbi:MAG: ATP synthase gamma chain [Acidimicrobiales bacterium]|nr:MAG: ATP synthase gamma chain [Acidimicrobiales bacterium]
MAGGQERALRRRIKSVQSTKKITRAMELIATTRVAKAQEQAAQARPYAVEITNVIFDLVAAGASLDHPLFSSPEGVRRAGFVVITSDRGLCGAYNSTIIRMAERELQARRAEGDDYSLILVGAKARSYFAFRGYRIDRVFTGISDKPSYEDAKAVADEVLERFRAGELSTVDLCYTRFLSIGTQRPVVRRFMPLRALVPEESEGERTKVDTDGGPRADFEFEPSPEAILDAILPRYVEARIYSALLDSAASEHAARQRAMKAATDNAQELIVQLTRMMNRARQDAITTEIMEVVGGAEALREAKAEREDLLPDRLAVHDFFPDRPTERVAR